LLSTGWFQEWI